MKHAKSRNGPSSRPYNEARAASPAAAADDKAAKLAAMRKAAEELDNDRHRRIASLTEKEAAQKEAEDAERALSSKLGGKGEFMHGVNRRVGDMALADRVRRSKGGMQRDEVE